MTTLKTSQEASHTMWICLCNRLNDQKIKHAAEKCDGSVSGLFRELQCQPRCGQCVPHMREHISAVHSAQTGAN